MRPVAVVVFFVAGACSAVYHYTLQHRLPEFAEFSSAEGKFKVLMPSGRREEGTAPVPGSNLSMRCFTSSLPDGIFGVSYIDMPFPGNPTREQIEFALDEGARHFQGTFVTSEQATLAGKYPGRAFRAELGAGKGLSRGRVYLVAKRMYLIMAMGEPDLVNSSVTDRFLDSLTILP